MDTDLVKQKIKAANKIAIVSHRSPDGDSIGSSLGLYHFLKEWNQQIHVFTPDKPPAFLKWMADFSTIDNYESNEAIMETINDSELIFCLDFNDLSRLGEMYSKLSFKDDAYIINIDHHQEPKDFAHLQISDTSASSTAELIYNFAKDLDPDFKISSDFASCLYTGIMTDTGSFRFSATTAKTHAVVAKLMQANTNFSRIHQLVYDSFSVDRLKLLGFALHEKLRIYKQEQIAIISLSEHELKQFDFKRGDTEGIVNFPLSIEDILISILLTQKDGKVKLSFRSKGDKAVNSFARDHFSGGGHINAAGGISDLSVEDTIKKIESLFSELN